MNSFLLVLDQSTLVLTPGTPGSVSIDGTFYDSAGNSLAMPAIFDFGLEEANAPAWHDRIATNAVIVWNGSTPVTPFQSGDTLMIIGAPVYGYYTPNLTNSTTGNPIL